MQVLTIPPHAHDIHQMVEHAAGCSKAFVQEKLDKYEGSLDRVSHADVQQLVHAGAQRYTAKSFRDNVHRWVQCLRKFARACAMSQIQSRTGW